MSELWRTYWDSSVFCSFLSEEADRFKIVEDLLQEAKSGNLEIVTSSFSLVEVLKLKSSTPIPASKESKISLFFEYPFIKIVDANWNVCELARKFVWKHKLHPKDAVHAATAEIASKIVPIHHLFSWDDDFLKLDGKVGLSFPFKKPFMHQTIFDFPPDPITEPEKDNPN